MDEGDKAKLKRELRKLHSKKPEPEHSVNFYLLVIIVVLLVALVATALYSFWKYDSAIEENAGFVRARSMMEDQLKLCEVEINSAKQELTDLNNELNISSASRTSLNDLYVDLSNLRSQLENDLTGAQGSLSECNLQLQEYADNLNAAIDELNDYILLYNQKSSEVSGLNTKISDLEDDLDASEILRLRLVDDVDDLEDCIVDYNCTQCIS